MFSIWIVCVEIFDSPGIVGQRITAVLPICVEVVADIGCTRRIHEEERFIYIASVGELSFAVGCWIRRLEDTDNLVSGLSEDRRFSASGFHDRFADTPTDGVVSVARILQSRHPIRRKTLQHAIEVPGHAAATVVGGHVAFGVVLQHSG